MSTRKLLATTLLAGMLAASSASAAPITSLDKLPDKGTVSLQGVVDSVEGERSLTLRDETGKTIDVKTETALNVSEGDKIEVSGTVKPSYLGMKHEIASATVTKLFPMGVEPKSSPDTKSTPN